MNDEQFDKLSQQIATLADSVSAQGKQIADMGEQFGKQFAKLYRHVEKTAEQLRVEIGETRTDVQHVYEVVDSVLKNQETDQQERLIVSHQLDRHEGWIKQLAKKTETRLSYE